MANTLVNISSNSEVFQFSGGQKPPIGGGGGGGGIIERS